MPGLARWGAPANSLLGPQEIPDHNYCTLRPNGQGAKAQKYVHMFDFRHRGMAEHTCARRPIHSRCIRPMVKFFPLDIISLNTLGSSGWE